MEQNTNSDIQNNYIVCSCERITEDELTESILEHDLKDLATLQEHLGAGTGCGRCVPHVKEILLQHNQTAVKIVDKE